MWARLAMPIRDRSDFEPVDNALQQIPGGSGTDSVRVNQGVGLSRQPRIRKQPFAQLLVERRIRVHLAFILKILTALVQLLHRAAHQPG